ncbi:MAG: hypothetical protein AAF702_41060 [Chloroflexota bacterium]
MNKKISTIMQSLWIGNPLSKLEQLSMRSFLANGHEYHLYTYADVANVPNGVKLKDANEIIPEQEIFVAFEGHVSFSDWFRWELLYQKGNWWVDTDVICLRQFDFNEEIVYGKEGNKLVGAAVLCFPSKHKLARFLADTCAAPNRFLPYDSIMARLMKHIRKNLLGDKRSNISWGEAGGPAGFTKALHHFGLLEFSQPTEIFYPIPWQKWQRIFTQSRVPYTTMFPQSYAIHFWNERTRHKKGVDKNGDFPKSSIFEQLKDRYMKELV